MLAVLLAFLLPQSQPASRPHFDQSHWESLFDGRSLQGWVQKGGRYDGNARWTVEDGALTGREGDNHAGGLIYTERAYQDFAFACDVWLSWPFDSGVFVRMVPPPVRGAQLTLDYRGDGEVGAVYADQFLQHNAAGRDQWRRDQWNHVEVRCVGKDFHLEAWLNGSKLTDYTLPAGSTGYAPAGLIGLQVHGNRTDPAGSKVMFKNLRVLELPGFDPALFTLADDGTLAPTAEGQRRGWRALFNGKDLAGWTVRGDPRGYVVRGGMLCFPSKVGGTGEIVTEEDFTDFELRLDFKIAKMANSGVFLRGDRKGGDPAWSGCEVQILDDFHWEQGTNSKLQDWQFTGALYGSVAPASKALRPIGGWNTCEITFQGSRIKTVLNGVTLYDVDTLKVPVAYPDRKAFKDRAGSGFLGLQRHSAPGLAGEEYAWFRNVLVRKL
jgi:hypothetical protein